MELSADRLVGAYRRGIFPWYSEGQPVLWWSPNPRMVLRTDEFRASRSLKARIRRQTYTVTTDTNFRRVVEECATTKREGQAGTWITDAMMDAYVRLHALGYAHSVEAWCEGELVGGLYGLAIARVFFGESMYAHRTDASKVAFSALIQLLRDHDVPLVDCQQETAHLASLGARPIERTEFTSLLATLIPRPDAPGWWPSGPLPDYHE